MIKEISVQVSVTDEQMKRLETLSNTYNGSYQSTERFSAEDMLGIIISSNCFQNLESWIKSAERVSGVRKESL